MVLALLSQCVPGLPCARDHARYTGEREGWRRRRPPTILATTHSGLHALQKTAGFHRRPGNPISKQAALHNRSSSRAGNACQNRSGPSESQTDSEGPARTWGNHSPHGGSSASHCFEKQHQARKAPSTWLDAASIGAHGAGQGCRCEGGQTWGADHRWWREPHHHRGADSLTPRHTRPHSLPVLFTVQGLGARGAWGF